MTPPTQLSARVAALLEKTRRSRRGRLIFALDATASREAMWDVAARLQASMFQEAAAVGGLDVQLVYYRGTDECRFSRWAGDANELAGTMTKVFCRAGTTQIEKILKHTRSENEREKVNAVVFVGDAVEESPRALYAVAANLGVPLFMFQEGDDLALHIDQRGEIVVTDSPQTVEQVFRELARLTNGAYGKFNRRRQAARRVAARGRRVRGRRPYRARQSAHR